MIHHFDNGYIYAPVSECFSSFHTNQTSADNNSFANTSLEVVLNVKTIGRGLQTKYTFSVNVLDWRQEILRTGSNNNLIIRKFLFFAGCYILYFYNLVFTVNLGSFPTKQGIDILSSFHEFWGTNSIPRSGH